MDSSAPQHESLNAPSPAPLLPVQYLLEEEIKRCDNPYITYETLVLRLVKRLLADLNIPWTHVLDTVRQGPCLLDKELHHMLQHMWNRRKRQVSLDEQHCIERILGHDHNRVGDMMKLASVLNKIADPRDVYHFFAMDGFMGDDPKRYTDTFRCGPDDLKYKHFQAVRDLYRRAEVENPVAMRELLNSIFEMEEEEETDDSMHGPRDVYVWHVGGWQAAKELAEWRRDQEEKSKRKRPAEEDRQSVSKVAKTEE